MRVPTLHEDRSTILDLYARYALYLDTGAVKQWAALYTEDAEFISGGDHVVGRAALEEYARRLVPGSVQRMLLGHVIDVDGDTARCVVSVLLTSGLEIVSIGRATDDLRRVDGTWRIRRRTFEPRST